ncbi:MAG: MtrB/PioB family decaheme-associated outer membrane protein [Xanthomonadales bacterium]|nr:MtrB/PioB family decaheme-associated outer membrane protein [Xanthomonadales bacterium]
MKHHSKYSLQAALGTILALSLGNPLPADEMPAAPDTSTWECKLCLVSQGWMGDWGLGLIYVDDPTPKFADWRGLDDDWFIEASGQSSYRSEAGNYFDITGRNLGLESRVLEARGGKQGTYELRARYQEVPRYLGHGTVSPYTGVGTDQLTLADDWAEASSFQPVALKTKRKTLGAGLTVDLGRNWRFIADVERQEKKGTRTFGGGIFAVNGALFPAPVDYTTQLIDLGLEYTGSIGGLRLGFSGSDFSNGNDSVTWDNPFVLGFGDDVSRSALAPDNKFYQVNLAGAVRFGNRVRLSGKFSTGEIEQDELFLPYSINPAFEDRLLPRDSLDGKVELAMANVAGRLNIKLADRVDLTAQYRWDERDNQTPVDTYEPVLLEVFPSSARSNRPYGYEREQGWAELRFRARYNLRLNLGIKSDERERTYQEVFRTEETSYWGDVQFMPWAWLDARLKLERSQRDADPSMQQGNFGRPEHPLMRKFYMADRDRDRVLVELYLMPTERFDFGVTYYTTDDDYDETVIGLRESEESSISFNLNYVISDKHTIYGFFTRDEIEAEIAGAASTDAYRWLSMTEDRIDTWGVGISGELTDKLGYGFDYVQSKSDGDILTDDGGGEGPFPVLFTDLSNARVYLDYRFSDRWSAVLDAYREQYDSDDWTVDGIGPLDIDGILNMGELSPDYDVYVVRLFARIRF